MWAIWNVAVPIYIIGVLITFSAGLAWYLSARDTRDNLLYLYAEKKTEVDLAIAKSRRMVIHPYLWPVMLIDLLREIANDKDSK